MKKLWLDDARPAPDNSWTWVKTYDDALATLASLSSDDIYQVISVEAKTGYDVICWIEEQIFNGDMDIPNEIRCHSANQAGKKRIELAVKNIQKRLDEIPFL